LRSVKTPAQQIGIFLTKFEPRVAASARSALSRLRKRLPGATEIVYDNYNALAIGFGPSDKASEAIFSIAVFPRWVSLFFLQGAKLPDSRYRQNNAPGAHEASRAALFVAASRHIAYALVRSDCSTMYAASWGS
jgi:hypothetical protein